MHLQFRYDPAVIAAEQQLIIAGWGNEAISERLAADFRYLKTPPPKTVAHHITKVCNALGMKRKRVSADYRGVLPPSYPQHVTIRRNGVDIQARGPVPQPIEVPEPPKPPEPMPEVNVTRILEAAMVLSRDKARLQEMLEEVRIALSDAVEALEAVESILKEALA